MSNIRIEEWAGHKIRFVEKGGEWWAVAADVCAALGLRQVTRAITGLKDGVTNSKVIDSLGREQEANIINEKAIYRLAFKSRKKEAEEFQDWVFSIIKQLREATGLEGFQIFRILDKQHQKEAMAKLCQSLKKPVRVDFIKANTITNKAISSKFGIAKMVKKQEMSPTMLVDRQKVLDDTVDLMATVEKFGLNVPVADTIYRKHLN